MRPTLLLALLLSALLLGAVHAAAHTVETLDGTVHEGRVVIDNDEKVVIATTFGERVTVPRAEVKRVDKLVPPLREQLQYRADQAQNDVPKLWNLHKWAKEKGFEAELELVLLRIVELAPTNAKARKLLGHEKVDGTWMTPSEKEAYLAEQHEAEMRAKGLVEYEGRWVTPEEREALEQGLLRDGDEWVTEDEYHRRRGEVLRGGTWIRLGEKEAKDWLADLKTSRVSLDYFWQPHVDVFYDVDEDHARRVADGAEAAWKVFQKTLHPTPETYAAGLAGRTRLHLFLKLPAYARFAAHFDKLERCSDLVKGWLASVRRQHSFWWVDPVGVVGAYKFPNTPRTFVSNAVHNLGYVWLTRYRFNYRFPKQWMLEGFAYYLEMEALGYTATFSVSRGGTAAASASGQPVWMDSDKWREALSTLVKEGQDPPMKRIAKMTHGQMHYIELAKCWSIVECMIRYDGAKFEAFIEADKDRALTTDDALKKAYGWTWRDLDRIWRRYVMLGFRHTAPAPAEDAAE